MVTFRKKIFFTYVVVFVIVLAVIFPFTDSLIKAIINKTMEFRADELIVKLKTTPTDEAMVRMLKERSNLLFFRVSVITSDRQLLFDSHSKRLLGPKFSQEYVVEHPEVLEAFTKGIAFKVEYSDLLGQKFAYMAKAFDYHGKKYVIRTAFPYSYVSQLTEDSRIGVLALATLVLFFFSIMTWFIIHRLTSPIPQIIDAIEPYQSGKSDQIPNIHLQNAGKEDDFSKLAATLNSLSQRVQSQIATLTGERNEKEAILESLIEGVVAVDTHGIITYANDIALSIFEKSREELVNQHFSTAEDPICEEMLAKSQRIGNTCTQTIERKYKGRKAYFNIIAAPKGDGHGAIVVLQDMSQHYRIKSMRKDFIANASHELKTPITIIRGFAETLHDNPTLPTGTLEDITEKIVRNCNKMTSLIKDLLALSDIENLPTSRLMDVDIADLIEGCKKTLQDVYPDAKIELVHPGGITVIGDANLLEMAFMNLLDNAAKYSKPPAEVTVTITEEKDTATISFADKGLGIPQEELGMIFERFYSADRPLSKKMGGSGLGLAIVDTIVEKHYGKISVTSKVDQGTTFTVKLPTNLDKLIEG